MKSFIITSDTDDLGLRRVAVWQADALLDLYTETPDKPDLSGAVVAGKIIRLLGGSQAGWADVEGVGHVYFEGKKEMKAGQVLRLLITTRGSGKAAQGKILGVEKSATTGVLTPPPSALTRALAAYQGKGALRFLFQREDDFKSFRALEQQGDWKVELSHQDPLFDRLEEELAILRDPVVPLQGGGSLVIEPTEALVAIDVNGEQTKNATAFNLRAVPEALRQVRLRNLSGIIVIDCLKMPLRTDASKLVNAAQRIAAQDGVETRVFGLTKLGLLEITRAHNGPPLKAHTR